MKSSFVFMIVVMVSILLYLQSYWFSDVVSRMFLFTSKAKEAQNSVQSARFRLPKLTRMSLSIVVPSIASDIPKIPRLLQSISAQSYPPLEVIVVLSGSSSESCRQLDILSLPFEKIFNVTRICLSQLQNQAQSRNDGINIAKGEWISFIDADDQKQPFFMEVFVRYLKSRCNMKLFLHGHSDSILDAEPVEHEWEVLEGDKLWNEEISTRDKHPHLTVPVMHSQATVHSSVTKFVSYRTEGQYFRSEDSYFVRDIIRFLWNSSSTIVFDSKPLGWYVPHSSQS
jgi:glycosyltransferase involved in cell wall biosynthesis